MQFAYMAAILFSAFGMTILDYRHRLAFFYDPRRASLALLAGLVIFSLWDFLGIHFGIFFSKQSAYSSGLFIAPDFPVEEVLFLLFLSYFTLIMYRLGDKKWRSI